MKNNISIKLFLDKHVQEQNTIHSNRKNKKNYINDQYKLYKYI